MRHLGRGTGGYAFTISPHLSGDGTPHLEVTVQDGTPQKDVTAIIDALSTISHFFHLKLDVGSGGNGSTQRGLASATTTIGQHSSEVSRNDP